MKIKYVHVSDPQKEKLCDTVVWNKSETRFTRRFFRPEEPMTPQDEYDKWILKSMKSDKKKGYILFYQII